MLTNEDLLSISSMMDGKLKSNLKPIENRLTGMELLLENNVLPRLQNMEACYTSTYERYKNQADRAEASYEDIRLIKDVVTEHSRKMQTLYELAENKNG